MSKKKKRKSSGKYIPDLHLLIQRGIKHNRPKQKRKTSTKTPASSSPSLASAKVKLKVPSPKKKQSPKTDATDGNLLQQYKYYQNYGKLPTNRELAWSKFLDGLDELPAEIRIKFVQEIDYLRYTYGDQVVAYYLDKHGLLDEIVKFSSVDYKSTMAFIYLYNLARGLELAVQGDISDLHYDLRGEAEWSINRTVKPKNQGYFEALMEDDAIRDINLTIDLDEYVDSLWDETD